MIILFSKSQILSFIWNTYFNRKQFNFSLVKSYITYHLEHVHLIIIIINQRLNFKCTTDRRPGLNCCAPKNAIIHYFVSAQYVLYIVILGAQVWLFDFRENRHSQVCRDQPSPGRRLLWRGRSCSSSTPPPSSGPGAGSGTWCSWRSSCCLSFRPGRFPFFWVGGEKILISNIKLRIIKRLRPPGQIIFDYLSTAGVLC